ncbi:MAG TPA: zinc ribbon domain-containing protein [Candidatus Cryosericum sp.]
MYCPMCGKETPDRATFCPACGTNLTSWRKRPAPAFRADREGRTESNEAVRTIKARVQTRNPRNKLLVGIYITLTLIGGCVLGLAVTQGWWISLPNISIPQIPFASNGGGETPTGADNYEYWNSPTDSSYYLLNSSRVPAVKVTGKPFMVLTRDRISLDITDCEFGLSEVTQEGGDEGFPEPTLNAEMIDFHEKLGLKSPVDLIVSWSLDLPGGGNKTPIVNGVQQFSFLHPANAIGPGKNSEKWLFNYTGAEMEGGVTIVGSNPSIEPAANAFKLQQR